jgi:multiple sugar transport system ATP-binding protein
MNFLPAEVSGDVAKLPFGDVSLPAEVRSRMGADGSRSVIAGIRPESFEDASLLSGDARSRGTTFRAKVDLVESMGAEKYAYFQVQHEGVQSQELQELAADSGADEVPSSGEGQVVARLAPESTVSRGQELELWLDATKLHFFDPQSGQSLTAARQPAAAGAPA